jgi:hypothetical protein
VAQAGAQTDLICTPRPVVAEEPPTVPLGSVAWASSAWLVPVCRVVGARQGFPFTIGGRRGEVTVMVEAARDLLAFTDVQARRLAGVSMRRLRYWEQAGLVVPSIKKKLSPHNTVRLYSFQDLLALLV